MTERWIPTTELPAIIGCKPRTARHKVKAWGLRVERDPADSRRRLVPLAEVRQRLELVRGEAIEQTA